MDRHRQQHPSAQYERAVPCSAAARRVLRAAGLMLLLASSLYCAGPADAQPALDPPPLPESSLAGKLRTRGDLTLRDATLTEAIFSISETWKVNVVVGEVEGRVNGVFTQATLAEILDAILLTNGYSYRPVGQSLVIMKISELGDSNPLFDTAIIPLRHANPSDILNVVQVLSSPRGKVHAIESTKSLLVIDFPEKLKTIRDRAADLDDATAKANGIEGDAGNLNVGYFTPQYIKVETVQDALTNLLSESGKLAVIPEENRIVVTDFDNKLRTIGRAIEQLDYPRPQVRIAALIYDISLEDMERLGINWSQGVKSSGTNAEGVPEQLWSIDTITSVAPAVGAANGTMAFLSMSEYFDLRGVVNALQQAGDSRLLADPNVTVIDNETAMMAVVREIPYQQLTQTGQGGEIGTTAFREAGIKLEVTPHIAADGTIAMDVTPSFSRLVGFTEGDNQPIIDRREAKTRVRVSHGRTLVIGGLRQRQDIGDFNGIPGLKDMKHLGKLFRSRQTVVNESELVVFITPFIVPQNHGGRPRELAAFDTGNCWLDRIPVAKGCAPGCRDDGGQNVDPELIPPHEELPEYSHKVRPPAHVARRPEHLDGPQRLPNRSRDVNAGRYPQLLPPVDRGAPSEPQANDKDSEEAPPEPLRLDYSRRYRDPGQPYQEQPEKKEVEQPAKEAPNLWQRMFRF